VDAPIYVAAKVVDQMLLKDSQGKPVPPRTAVRDLRTLAKPPAEDYPNITAALRALELQPGCQQARTALSEISGRHVVPPRIRDAVQGIEQVEAWAKKHEGTPLEAVGLGLVGAAHLWGNQRDPAKALPYLERAYRLAPNDRLLALDLATAYTLLNRKREALGLLRKHDLSACKPDFGELTNFDSLRCTAWFRKHTHDQKPDTPRWFMSFQFYVAMCERESSPPPKEGAEAEDTLQAGPGVKTYPIPKVSSQHRNMRAALFADTPLRSVDRCWGSYVRGKQRPDYCLLLRVEAGGTLRILATPHERNQALLPPYTTPRPMTVTTAVRTLRRLGIRFEAVVIQRQVRSVPRSVLVLTDGTRRETVPISGLAAVALAVVAKCPLLIADRLAKQLTLRDDAGNPIPFGAAHEYFFPHAKITE
jgi:bifunctional DNase/RNase